MKIATYYHASLKPMSRSAGKSAVNCVAYRTGSKLWDERYGTLRDYSRKSDVVTSFTLAPEDAPAWAHEAGTLWNAAEAKENRKNSIVAYEWEVALPNEFDDAQRQRIARLYGDWLVEEYGVGVTIGIHNGGDRGNGLNDHMHAMMTPRPIDENGWEKNKLRDFNCRPGQPNPEVERVRAQIATFINDELASAGSEERVTHESYRGRGIEIEGTKKLGPAASALENDGISTDRGDINRSIIAERVAMQRQVEEDFRARHDSPPPHVTEDVEKDLAGRFGDDFTAALERMREAAPVPAFDEQVTREARPLADDISQSARTDFPEPPRGWRERMRQVYEHVVAFFHDENSGPRQAPAQPDEQAMPGTPTAPGDAPAQTAEPEAPRSWVSRVMGAARGMFHRDAAPEPDAEPAAPPAEGAAAPDPARPATPAERSPDWAEYAAQSGARAQPQPPGWRDYANSRPQRPPASPSERGLRPPEPDIDLDL